MLPLIFINNIKINNMETKQIKCYCGHTIYCDCSPLEEPKQETLEEREPYWDLVDAKAEQNNTIDLDAYAKGVQDGAKWQAERMYSEEDVREAFRQGQDNMDYSNMYGWDTKLTEQEWFEQFKKK